MSMTPATWQRTVALIDYESPMRDEAAKETWMIGSIFTTGATKDHQKRGYLYSGTGLPKERKYSAPIKSEDMVELGEWTINDIELAMGLDWDMRLIEDDRHVGNLLNEGATSVGESFGQARCLWAANVLNYAFDEVAQPLWDAYALCDTAIPLYVGGTYSNSLAPATPSYDSIYDMILYLKWSQVSQKGLKRRGVPYKYVYHPVHEKVVRRVFEQGEEPALRDLGTDNRADYLGDKNLIKGSGIQAVQCMDMVDEDASFMFARRSRKNLIALDRKKPTTEWEDNPRNRTRSGLTHSRLLVGVKDRIDVVGIPGA